MILTAALAKLACIYAPQLIDLAVEAATEIITSHTN